MVGVRDSYLNAISEIESYYAMPSERRDILKILPLVRNGIFLIFGPYGYGKTLYADLVRKVIFGMDKESGRVTLNAELTIHDVFFWIDAGKLAKGMEVVEPRGIITSPFKFINELQRGNGRVYNALLSLMSERKMYYRDKVFGTPDFLMIMDSNPFDSSSVEIPRALLDRVTASFTMLMPDENEREKIMYLEEYGPMEKVQKMMNYSLLKRAWKEVENIVVSKGIVFLLTHLVTNYLNVCIHGSKEYFNPEIMPEMCNTCRWKHEPCSELVEPLGQRWWIDTLKLSKARAYLEGRESVSIDDIWFSMPYALSHRAHLREEVLIKYASPELWAHALVERVKQELKSRWMPVLNGDIDLARDSVRTLGFLRGENLAKS